MFWGLAASPGEFPSLWTLAAVDAAGVEGEDADPLSAAAGFLRTSCAAVALCFARCFDVLGGGIRTARSAIAGALHDLQAFP